jgi:hypothetical protein
MTILVLVILFLFMYPGVRWRIAELNLYVRSSLPYGGNPLLDNPPQGARADMVIIESRFGANSELMSGRYFLRRDKVHGRYSWFKNAPGQEAYLVWDACGAWLISRFPTGQAPSCEGWSFTQRCYGMPWDCAKTWQIREDGRWEQAGNTVNVTPVYNIGKDDAKAVRCSPDQESDLTSKFSKFDIVIPWINGSDPQWLEDRARVCEDWQWQEMWLDAVTRSWGTKECLKDPASVKEATALLAKGGCLEGIMGQEGKCAWGQVKEAPRGLTTRSSRCFRKFVDAHCTSRVNSIKDHDELRYLLRSIERHLPWHQGRILLIPPRDMTPSWLKLGGRLEILTQEDLLLHAVNSNGFVNAADRGRAFEWAPDRIFNDYPVQAALAFIPNANRVLMLLQDDLLFARPASICDFFTTDPNGLRLFARPFEGVVNRDSYSQIYESMEQWTTRLFCNRRDCKSSPYYRDLHLPHMLDKQLLKDLWSDHADVLSDAVSSSFRHPNLTNVIALHHAEAARREPIRTEKSHDTSNEDEEFDDLAMRIDNLVMNISGQRSMKDIPWMEVVFESISDWDNKIARIPPDPLKLPGIIGFQDNLGAEMQDQVAELDCLKEKWLNKLLPGPSSWEDSNSPPRMCGIWESFAKHLAAASPTPRQEVSEHSKKSETLEL